MIVFVGTNPSEAARTLEPMCKSTSSGKKFNDWIEYFGLPEYSFKVINVIDRPTPNNRVLRTSDITPDDIFKLRMKLSPATKIVALGVTSAAILETLDVEYFPMIHPSPVSRKHNDKDLVKEKLDECRKYILQYH